MNISVFIFYVVFAVAWIGISVVQFGIQKQSKRESEISLSIFYIWQKALILTIGYVALNDLFKWESFSTQSALDHDLIGMGLTVIGLAMFYLAKKNLGTSFSPCFKVEIPELMVSHGLYSKIRHPIYTANIILLLGVSLVSGSTILMICTFFTLILYNNSAKIEESTLKQEFTGYTSYMGSTGRFLPKI